MVGRIYQLPQTADYKQSGMGKSRSVVGRKE
nr:MAG TPA: hypothetical protein [Caudoviricetes sp.]